MNKITPFLWFDTEAGEAAQYYTTVFKNSKINHISKAGDQVMMASFQLEGQEFIALNAGPEFKFNEAVSFFVNCEDQAEVDYYWNKILNDGGGESQCGWLKDKFGLWWQIVPKQLGELMGDPDREKAGRVMQSMMKMRKIVVADLQKAYDGE